MLFCGQCGLQLPPGSSRCPRCGAPVEESEVARNDLHVDDPTVASPSFIGRHPSGPGLGSSPGAPGTPPQQLVLRPGSPDYNNPGANDATSLMEAPGFNSGMVPQNMRGSFGGYSSPGNYPEYGTQAGYMPTPSSTVYGSGQQMERGNKNLRTAGLVLVVIGVLLIMSAVILFALQQNGMLASGNGGDNGVTVTTVATATDQAKAVVQHYYDAINRRDYQTAYSLWKNSPQSFSDFSNGFKNTKKDQLTIQKTEQQADGSVRVAVTVQATENSANGETQSTYSGYYIVDKDNDTWKIVDASLQKQS